MIDRWNVKLWQPAVAPQTLPQSCTSSAVKPKICAPWLTATQCSGGLAGGGADGGGCRGGK